MAALCKLKVRRGCNCSVSGVRLLKVQGGRVYCLAAGRIDKRRQESKKRRSWHPC